MRNLLNPRWIFIINLLPVLLLFFLYLGEFSIIKTLLSPENKQLWLYYGISLTILGFLSFIYALYAALTSKKVSQWYAFIALITHILFIYFYYFNVYEIIPSNIPRWMISTNISMYVGTFLMPTLIYSLFILVNHFTPEYGKHTAWKNFLIAVIVPISFYLFSLLLLPAWRVFDFQFGVHAVLIVCIISTLVFLFFLIRGVYILASKKGNLWVKYQLYWKIPICIILPLVGLSVNNGHIFNNFGSSNGGIFGDFNSIWFYTIAFINGLLLCIPNLENNTYRKLLFVAKSITFSYSFYFFMVFLPFSPISVVAIVAFGIGFLMLVPLVLFIIHIKELSKDYEYLRNKISKKTMYLISCLGFLVLPIIISLNYTHDRSVLNETLEYVYNPEYSKSYELDTESLKNTLKLIKAYKDKNGDFIFGSQVPYLSTYFKWLVLDNLSLSDSKIGKLEKIFLGETTMQTSSWQLASDTPRNADVHITEITSESNFDSVTNSWTSWVNLEISNGSENNWFSEYATTFELPEGSFISDYYLYVGDKKEMGILAEKKSALWVFSNIRNENKDPGLLYYLKGNKVAFRVFPFAKNEVRRTGIQLIHKTPITFSIDDCNVLLGSRSELASPEIYKNAYMAFIPANKKEGLKSVKRKPYFHFIVDASKQNRNNAKLFIQRIEKLKSSYPKPFENAQVSITNSEINTYQLNDNWQENYLNHNFEGGFFADRALKMMLVKAYETQSKNYPVPVIVTDSMDNAILDTDFSDFKITYPETDLFYVLQTDGSLHTHSLMDNPLLQIKDTTTIKLDHNVLEYHYENDAIVYLPNNSKASIVLKQMIPKVLKNEIKEKDWATALTLKGQYISQTLKPKNAQSNWLNLVGNSFISKIMSPVTSYIVVENEAQKAILKKKQEQVLSGNKNLDIDEDTPRMSEPSLFILLFLIGLFILYREKKLNRST